MEHFLELQAFLDGLNWLQPVVHWEVTVEYVYETIPSIFSRIPQRAPMHSVAVFKLVSLVPHLCPTLQILGKPNETVDELAERILEEINKNLLKITK